MKKTHGRRKKKVERSDICEILRYPFQIKKKFHNIMMIV